MFRDTLVDQLGSLAGLCKNSSEASVAVCDCQQELKLKDEECEKLSKLRGQMETEINELTASLFEVSQFFKSAITQSKAIYPDAFSKC